MSLVNSGLIKHKGVPYFKAGEGTRTLDIQLGKLTLYQLSYARENK